MAESHRGRRDDVAHSVMNYVMDHVSNLRFIAGYEFGWSQAQTNISFFTIKDGDDLRTFRITMAETISSGPA